MHRRILFGVVAWLLGAATATAGSLLASSLLGQGITGNSGQLLTRDAVNRALASEAAETSPAATPGGQSAIPAATPSSAAASVTPAPAAPTATAAPAQDPAAATAGASDQADGTVLTSAGGDVVASCQPSGAYLISWSPLQGYEVSSVNRGPADPALVTFASAADRVTMAVSCSAGVPSATSHSSWGGDD